MATVLTTTKTPVKDLLHLLMEKINDSQTHKPGEDGLLVKISGLCAKVMNERATEVYTENVSCHGVDAQLQLCHIPYSIRAIDHDIDNDTTTFRIEPDSGETGRDTQVVNIITRYLSECSVTGTMIEIDTETHRFMAAITELYNAAFGPFYKNCRRIYTVDELNMLFMHRRIPFHLCKTNILDERYPGHPMPGFILEGCNW